METTETVKAGLPIRVLVADDQRLVREGLCSLLDTQSDIVVIGAAENGADALRLANALRPDILLLDLVMPCFGGIEVARQLQGTLPDTKIVVFSMLPADPHARLAMEAGAVGYLLKGGVAAEIPTAIRAAHNGRRFQSPHSHQAVSTIARKGLQLTHE